MNSTASTSRSDELLNTSNCSSVSVRVHHSPEKFQPVLGRSEEIHLGDELVLGTTWGQSERTNLSHDRVGLETVTRPGYPVCNALLLPPPAEIATIRSYSISNRFDQLLVDVGERDAGFRQ